MLDLLPEEVPTGSTAEPLFLLLQGGLGNQLMQYVLAQTLARRSCRPLIASTTLLTSRTRRFRGLTSRSVSPLLENRLLLSAPRWHREAWSRLIARLPGSLNSRVITDRCLIQAAHAANSIDELIDRQLIHTHATHPLVFQPLFQDCWRDILSQLGSYLRQPPPAIALHVRRADYLKPSSGFFVLTEQYYRSAIERALSILNPTEVPKVIDVFTDDPVWCDVHLRDHRWSLRIIPGSPESDLASMAHANLLITANSSLSAVAAHLAQLRNPMSCVLTPDKWLRVVDGRLGDLRKLDWQVVKC